MRHENMIRTEQIMTKSYELRNKRNYLKKVMGQFHYFQQAPNIGRFENNPINGAIAATASVKTVAAKPIGKIGDTPK